MIWKFSSLKTVIGSRLLQVEITGEKQELFRYYWELYDCCWTVSCCSSVIPMPVTHIPCDCSLPCCTVLSHTSVCMSKHPLWLTDRAAFWNFADHQTAKALNEVKDELRAEFHFALESPLPLLETLHAGFQAIQTAVPFHLLCSYIFNCNNFRRWNPCVLMLAQSVLQASRECMYGLADLG